MLYSSSDGESGAIALVFIYQLYDRYICNRPTFHHSIPTTLLELAHAIEKFTNQKAVLAAKLPCAKIFEQLTTGLHQTLRDLGEALEASEKAEGTAYTEQGDSLHPPNASRIGTSREKLRCYALSVETIVRAIER
jgi:hypothetical protein